MDSAKFLSWTEHAQLELDVESLCASLLRNFRALTEQPAGILTLRDGDRFQLTACEPTFPAWHEVVIPAQVMGELSALDSPRILTSSQADVGLVESSRSLSEFLRMQASGAMRLAPSVLIPLQLGPEKLGVVVLSSNGKEVECSDDDIPALRALASHAARALRNAQRFGHVCGTFHSFLQCVADAIDARDPYGSGHSRSVSHYSALIARQMGMPAREVDALELAGLLHDIGRLSIPDSILLKKEQLTNEEMQIIRSYPVRGAELLSHVQGLEGVVPFVRHQAERFDGKGYPDGLRGTDIPLGARILAVAHSFVAMISHRAYRGPMTVVSGALKTLEDTAGQALDPDVVRAFLSALGRGTAA